MSDIIYRTSNPSEWGTGQGSDLSADQIDMNFYILASTVQALQDHAGSGADIDYFNVVGDQFYVVLTNHATLGPYTLPVAQWTFTGAWTPNTPYFTMEVFTNNGTVYLVIYPHTSAATFDPNANDGDGHNYYAVILAQPEDELPDGGEIGQVLTVIDAGSPEGTPVVAWEYITRNLAVYVEGIPQANEVVLQYICPETTVLPAGLVGSQAYHSSSPSTEQVYTLNKNGVSIGTVTFDGLSPASITWSFSVAVTFNPGDVFTLVAPAVPDTGQVNTSFTFVASVAQAT